MNFMSYPNITPPDISSQFEKGLEKDWQEFLQRVLQFFREFSTFSQFDEISSEKHVVDFESVVDSSLSTHVHLQWFFGQALISITVSVSWKDVSNYFHAEERHQVSLQNALTHLRSSFFQILCSARFDFDERSKKDDFISIY